MNFSIYKRYFIKLTNISTGKLYNRKNIGVLFNKVCKLYSEYK